MMTLAPPQKGADGDHHHTNCPQLATAIGLSAAGMVVSAPARTGGRYNESRHGTGWRGGGGGDGWDLSVPDNPLMAMRCT